MAKLAKVFGMLWYIRYCGKASKNLRNTLTIEHGIISTYEHTGMLKINYSYVNNCEVLAALSLRSCCLLTAFVLIVTCAIVQKMKKTI
jgi:hypothetical protein